MSAQKIATSHENHRANVERQKAWRWNGIAQRAKRQWRAKAIERGEAVGLFKPFSKRPTDDVRAVIDEAVAAGRVTKVPRGVSALE